MGTGKREVRARLRAARMARVADPSAAEQVGRGLLGAAREAGLLPPGAAIACYVAAVGEPDTAAIRQEIRTRGGIVLLPAPLPGGQLAWVVDDGAYAPHATLGVPVPTGESLGQGAQPLMDAGVSLVLAPALAVDRTGARLGQGGGFYDRLMAEIAGRVPVVAVLHDDELLAAGRIPVEAHDWPVSGALMPGGLVRLPA